MVAKNVFAVFLVFNAFLCFDTGASFKANGEEIPDPVRASDQLFDSVADKRFDSFTNGFGESKRSFDEINRSSFGFNKRRNFDEIGRSSFGFNKRRDFDEIGRSSFGFNKRRNFDEIGRSSFGFNKKDGLRFPADSIDTEADELDMIKRGDFDEIGRSSFGFYRRSPGAPRPIASWRFSGFGKRNALPVGENSDKTDKRFDEINRSTFGFSRRADSEN